MWVRRIGQGCLVALALGAGAGGCGMERRGPMFHDESRDLPAFSAARLGDPFEEGSAIDFLEPDEQEAVRRLDGSELALADEGQATPEELREATRPQGGMARALDTAGKLGVVLLGVGLTLAAVVAPFFLL